MMTQAWWKTSEDVVLAAILADHPAPREFLVEAERMKDPEDFSFIYEGTISSLKRKGMIAEMKKARPKTMFRRFRMTASGHREAMKRGTLDMKQR